jgi:hypothetical protein
VEFLELKYGNNWPAPLVLVLDEYSPIQWPFPLKGKIDIKDLQGLIDLCAQILHVDQKEYQDRSSTDLYPIPITLMQSLRVAPTDIYVRIRKNQGKDHYVKRFFAGDSLSIPSMNRYLIFGELSLYIPTNEKNAFAQFCTQKIFDETLHAEEYEKESGELSPLDGQWKRGEQVQDLVRMGLEMVKEDEEVQELIQKSVTNLQNISKKFQSLSHLIQKLLENQLGYNYTHSQIICFICYHLLRKLPWSVPGHEEKLALVSFFHDILLTNDEWHYPRSQEELKNMNFQTEEEHIIKKHAALTSDLLQKLPSQYADVATIVKQHHGHPQGTSLDKGDPKLLGPLSLVFIVAEEITTLVLMPESKKYRSFQKKAVMDHLHETFSHEKFQSILEAASKLPLWSLTLDGDTKEVRQD